MIHAEHTVAFAIQHWLWDGAKMLRYIYIACLSVWVKYQRVKSNGVLSLVLVGLLHLMYNTKQNT
jgi:hypothetical protein